MEIALPNLSELVRDFLQAQHDPEHGESGTESDAMLHSYEIPPRGPVKLHPSAATVFVAPSDPSGHRGKKREYIRATPSWRNDGPRHDTAFVMAGDPDLDPMDGLKVVRIHHLFSFTHLGTVHPCAVVQWFPHTQPKPDRATGMWIVQPENFHLDEVLFQVIHLDTVLRLAHLLPVFDVEIALPREIHFSDTLNTFPSFYVNKYANHNTFDTLYRP